MKNAIVYITFALLTTACGWHLRGSMPGDNALMLSAPLNVVINTKDNHSPLLNNLRSALRIYNITEVNETTASYVLHVGPEMIDKRTAGVGSDALTSAYELILSVPYNLHHQGVAVTPVNTKATVSRTYNYNVNNASGAAQEEALVLREMRNELAQQILRRVKILANKPLTPTSNNVNSSAPYLAK